MHQPECCPDNAAVMPEEECQEDEEVPPLVGVANNIHQAREEPNKQRWEFLVMRLLYSSEVWNCDRYGYESQSSDSPMLGNNWVSM